MTESPTFTLDQLAQKTATEPPPPPAPPRRGRILVVDDETSITDLLVEFLGEMQFDVVAAHSGREALERLGSETADAILLDLHMPGMDGMETLRQIRARGAHPPILMITGNDDLAVAREALSLGAFDHILKPIDFDYLGRAVVKMLGGRKSGAPGDGSAPGASGSTPELLYDLSLEIFRVAREHGVALVPFLLEGVAGKAELNQRDGVHPNAEGQRG